MKAFLLNGPPRSGKDTAGEMLRGLTGGTLFKFADAVKTGAHTLHGFGWADAAYFEEVKEVPQEYLDGKTWRQAYIEFSEKMVKPVLGSDFFGKALVRKLKNHAAHGFVAIVTDCGFAEEIRHVIDYAGSENVRLIRMYRDGCTFEGDSRSYLHAAVRNCEIRNNGTLVELREKLKGAI